jgi:VWFA-related protein
MVFDLNFTERPWLHRSVQSAKNFVRERGGDDVDWSVAVIGASSDIILPFTSDTNAVLSALDSVSNRPTYRLLHSIDASLVDDPLRTKNIDFETNEPAKVPKKAKLSLLHDMTTSFVDREQAMRSMVVYGIFARTMSDIFRAYATVPGKKACIVVAGNMDLNPRLDLLANSTIRPQGASMRLGWDTYLVSQMDALNQVWEEIARLANTAGFRIYSANAMGLDYPVGYFDLSSRSAGAHRPSSSLSDWDTLPRALTDNTGGKYFATNDISPALEALDRDIKTYYSLAFQSPLGNDGEYRKIRVKVRKPGVRLSYRRGVYAVDAEVLLAGQLASPAEYPKVGGSLPVKVQVDSRTAGGDLEMAATVLSSVGSFTFVPNGEQASAKVVMMLAVYGSDGEILDLQRAHQELVIPADAIDAVQEQPFSYSMRFTLPRDEYTVAMAIYDSVSTRYGVAYATAK